MKLQELLSKKKENLLNIYFTAGFPYLNSLPEIVKSLEQSGVDMVEIGIPYSDPLSDGPTIQQSNSAAIANGISLDLIFKQLEYLQTRIPKIMMGYYNSVFQYGMEKFCESCVQTGISGIILPDLPIDIWVSKYKNMFENYGLSTIFLITPKTSIERIRKIDASTSSFIYAVSSAGTTGAKNGILGAASYLQKINELRLDNPILLGFNIAGPEDFKVACRYTNGGIIGSAFIKHIKNSTQLSKDIAQFIDYIKS
jgi:tryptophan synthase alpha chain